jgi:hypothetical protein
MTREEKKLSRNDSDGGAAARPFVVTRQFKPYDTRARQAGDSAVTLPGPFAPLDFKNQDARTNLGIDCIASWRKALGRSAQTPTVQLKGHLFSAHMSDQENRIQLPFGPLTTAGRPKTNLRSVFELYVLLSDQFVADVAPMLASFKQVAFPEGLSGLDSFVLSTREPVKRDTLCSFVKLVIFMLEFARAVDSEQGVVVGKNARGDVRLPAPDKPDQYMTDFVFGPRIAHPRAADSPSNWALPRVNLIPPKLKDNHICLRFNSFNASFWMSKWLHHMLLFWRQPPLTGSFEIVFSVCNRAEFEFDLRRYVQSPVVPAKSTVQSSAAPSAASSGAASASALALKSTAAPMEVSRLVGASSHGLKITIPNDKASVAKGAAREEKETKGTTYEAAASAGGIKRKFEDSADSDQQSAAKRAKTDVADKIPSAAAASAMDTSSDESKVCWSEVFVLHLPNTHDFNRTSRGIRQSTDRDPSRALQRAESRRVARPVRRHALRPAHLDLVRAPDLAVTSATEVAVAVEAAIAVDALGTVAEALAIVPKHLLMSRALVMAAHGPFLEAATAGKTLLKSLRLLLSAVVLRPRLRQDRVRVKCSVVRLPTALADVVAPLLRHFSVVPGALRSELNKVALQALGVQGVDSVALPVNSANSTSCRRRKCCVECK